MRRSHLVISDIPECPTCPRVPACPALLSVCENQPPNCLSTSSWVLMTCSQSRSSSNHHQGVNGGRRSREGQGGGGWFPHDLSSH